MSLPVNDFRHSADPSPIYHSHGSVDVHCHEPQGLDLTRSRVSRTKDVLSFMCAEIYYLNSRAILRIDCLNSKISTQNRV